MKLNKRVMVESVGMTLLIALVMIIWPVIQGMWLTRKNEPDIINEYATVDQLQSKVAFGVMYTPTVLGISAGVLSLLIFAIAYYGVRMFIRRKLN
ncbi:hypothetical protein SY83_19960 [Paenibacillus swuensis]|uniref:Uncharacterized protein n=1 Tax=Paenibacillus swuensis TaxID=1178515 RepID=A0A172TME7_9BACL|nr:hypothetical protein [Paenibacillus swuensis]ANE48190.1 hypothetical protein SY83_19960 [Paenibacillus swuensis]